MRAAVAIAVAVLCSSQAIASDDFCDHLNTFIRAPFVTQSTRSVQFYWIPGGILGTIQCVNAGLQPGKEFCGWLINNASREFSERLPEDVLRCNGFSFPPTPNVEDWKATYQFIDDKSERWLILEVRLAQPNVKYDGGIRISVLPKGQDTATHPLSPFPDPTIVDDSQKK